MNLKSASFALRPATRDDIPVLAQIMVHTPGMLIIRGYIFRPYVYLENRQTDLWLSFWSWRLELAFDDPTVQVTKAVDDDAEANVGTNNILGFAAWQHFTGYEAALWPSEEQQPNPQSTRKVGEPAVVEDLNMEAWRTTFGVALQGHATRRKGVEHMYLQMLYVQHDAQRGGIGSALMRLGLDQADREAMDIWVISMAESPTFYKRFGFQEVGHANIDIVKFRAELKWCGYNVRRHFGMFREKRRGAE